MQKKLEASWPHICGGYGTVNRQNLGKNVPNCYRYSPSEDRWIEMGALRTVHTKSGYTHHSGLGLVMIGNHDRDNQKCETTRDGINMKVRSLHSKYRVTIQVGPNLPLTSKQKFRCPDQARLGQAKAELLF